MGRHIGAVLGGAAVVIALGALLVPRPTAATPHEPKAAPKTGYVHLPKVFADSRKAKKMTAELNARRVELVERVQTLKAEVDAKQQAVTGVRFDAAEKRKLENEIIQARRQMEDLDRTAQREMAEKSQKVVHEIYKDVNEAASAVGREFALDAVLTFPISPDTVVPSEIEALMRTPGPVPLFVDKAADVTAEVLKRMNAKYDHE